MIFCVNKLLTAGRVDVKNKLFVFDFLICRTLYHDGIYFGWQSGFKDPNDFFRFGNY